MKLLNDAIDDVLHAGVLNVVSGSIEILVGCLEPAGVIVGVRHQVNIDESLLPLLAGLCLHNS